MKKIAGSFAVLVLSVIFSSAGSIASEKRIARLYELYNSTSTSKDHKQTLKRLIDREEYFKEMRGKSRHAPQNRVPAEPAPGERIPSANVVPPDPAFQLGIVSCYPILAGKNNLAFHIETGAADQVELKVYDATGNLVHEKVLTGPPQAIDRGQGARYVYRYLWNAKKADGGLYSFSMTAKKGDKTLIRTGQCVPLK